MRRHFIVVELEHDEVDTPDVVAAVDEQLRLDYGPHSVVVRSLPEDERLVRWKADNFDELMRKMLSWSKGAGFFVGKLPDPMAPEEEAASLRNGGVDNEGRYWKLK